MNQIYANNPLEIIEARLDWISATVKPGQRAEVVKGRVAAWIDAQVAEGNDRKVFKSPFYEGTRTRGIAFGERRDDILVTLSGDTAQKWGPTLVTWADNISRLDIQATFREPDLSADWATYVNHAAKSDNRVKAGQLSTQLIKTTPRGVTAYIGTGGSGKMCRVYDKAAESNDIYPPGAWRWEVQYRHERAHKVAWKLLDGSYLPMTILAAVGSAFQDYRITLPALCLPLGWKDRGPSSRTDDDRRLEWLRTSVAPCVEKLGDHYGYAVVMTALGLGAITDTLNGQDEDLHRLRESYAGELELRLLREQKQGEANQ
jgi:hypothetical protein